MVRPPFHALFAGAARRPGRDRWIGSAVRERRCSLCDAFRALCLHVSTVRRIAADRAGADARLKT